MRISVIGASAGVGLECVRTALARGHEVVTLSRSIAALPEHDRLRRVQGSATAADTLHRAIDGAAAVLVTLGTGKSMKPTTLYSDFGRALLTLQDGLGATPVLVLTGFGAGESGRYHGPVVGPLFRFFLGDVYADKTRMEAMITASALNWMLVRPGVLTNGAPQAVRVQTDYVKGMKVGFVSRRSVAKFMVTQAERPTLMKQRPVLG